MRDTLLMTVPVVQVEALLAQVRPLHRLLSRSREAALEDTPLTLAMGQLLELLSEGPQTASDLARHLDVPRQVVQRSVRGLLDLGYVERRPNPRHQRSLLIALTAPGERAQRTLAARTSAQLQSLATELEEAEVEACQKVVSTLVQRLALAG